MTTTIKPTVGRRVYAWQGKFTGFTEMDPNQAFDAGILFVHPDGKVNLAVTDHIGNTAVCSGVELRDPKGDEHGKEDCLYATWMPYQMGQAVSAEANKVSAPTPAPTPAPTQPPKK